jgi:Zn-dependent M16 (insulinase) family peptidase
MTFEYLLPSVREKGGAYGAGVRINESGLIDFYSFRDPNIWRTYENFERAVISACNGEFDSREIEEAKLLVF